MKKKTKTALKIGAAVIICPLAIIVVLALAMLISGFAQTEKNIEYQNNHIEYLKTEYYTDSYVPCDEQKLAAFDIEKAKSEDVRINEIAVMGTHNSYQLLATAPNRMFSAVLDFITFGKKGHKRNFEMDTLTEQLERGVRNLELDIETIDNDGSISFTVMHKPITDNVSSAYNFEKCLEEIALWSDNNPGHIPVYLLIEPKADVPEINNMKNFTADYALEFDKVLRKVLGDRLITPEAVKGDFESLKEMRLSDQWPTLSQAAGKIIAILHPCDATQGYIDADPTITAQAMFPVLTIGDADKSYTAFIIENDPSNAVNNKKTVEEKNLMVRSRADSYPNYSDERYAQADICGSHIITTDYPPRSVRPDDPTYTFDGYMIKLLK